MRYRTLGSTELRVSAIAFGAGPVPSLLTGDDEQQQERTVRRALEHGINWFDTAATYGGGQSEARLGAVLEPLGAAENLHIATKVRLLPEDLGSIEKSIRASVSASLDRLRRPRVTLLQLHNSITAARGDQPTSLAPADVLGPGGVLEAFEKLRQEGLVEFLGLTGIGQPEAMCEVIASGAFQTIQLPYHLLNPSAGQSVEATFAEADYGNIVAASAKQQMGVLAIRVFAGGALIGNPPSAHTHKTPFFPLDLYRRDADQAEKVKAVLPPGMSIKEAAVRFVLSHRDISAAIIGFGDAAHVDEAVAFLDHGPLPDPLLEDLRSMASQSG